MEDVTTTVTTKRTPQNEQCTSNDDDVQPTTSMPPPPPPGACAKGHAPPQQQQQQQQQKQSPQQKQSTQRDTVHESQIEFIKSEALKSFAEKLGTQSIGSSSNASGSGGPRASDPRPPFAPGTAASLAAQRLGLAAERQPEPVTFRGGGFGRMGIGVGLGGGTFSHPSAKPELVKYLHRDDEAFTVSEGNAGMKHCVRDPRRAANEASCLFNTLCRGEQLLAFQGWKLGRTKTRNRVRMVLA